jgi:hypothetical protein
MTINRKHATGSLTQKSEDLLELSPVPLQRHSWFRTPGLLISGLTILGAAFICWVAGVCCWLTVLMLQTGTWGMAVVFGLCAAAALWAIYVLGVSVFSAGVWFQFDRQTGKVIRLCRPFGVWRKPCPVEFWNLADIAALHLRYGGMQTVQHMQETQYGQWEPIFWTTQHHVYNFELQMTPESNIEPVIVLSSQDWAWLRELAPQISGFCGVPVIDHLQHGSTVTPEQQGCC